MKIAAILILFGFLVSVHAQDLKKAVSDAEALQKQGQFKEAVDLLKEAVKNEPDSPAAHLELGKAWGAWMQNANDMTIMMTNLSEVFVEMGKAVELDPNYIDARVNLGIWGIMVPPFLNKLDLGVENLEAARDLLKTGADADPELGAVVYRFLGQGYKQQGKTDAAKDAWKKVLALAPEGEHAKAATEGLKSLETAVITPEKKTPAKDSQAVADLKKKLEKSPEDFGLLYALGKAYYDEGLWVESQAALKNAVEKRPDDFDAVLLLGKAYMNDAAREYDERIHADTNLRTGLAFETVKMFEKAYELKPDNLETRLLFGISAVQMPFFVNRHDEGIAVLDKVANDASLPDSMRAEALYWMGYGLRKKGNAVWMQMAKKFPGSGQMDQVFSEYGLRESGEETAAIKGEKVLVTFHLGFMEELAPQTGVWVEDADGKFVKTLYVSGFSGYAKEAQVNLQDWAKKSAFETDGTTAASIDWGRHTYVWDLKDHQGKRVKDGTYSIQVEVSWWPGMKYGRASAEIKVGASPDKVKTSKAPYLPLILVQYVKS